jgi:hypothetical protein
MSTVAYPIYIISFQSVAIILLFLFIYKNCNMSERNPEIKSFINKHAHLFWYTPANKKEHISDELLVETILNYGTLDDFKELKSLMGLNNLASTFYNLTGRKKMNIYPEIYNFFDLYFRRHA